jgi:metal-responsive CopG/Arc/MetJ family transcriptional regulator
MAGVERVTVSLASDLLQDIDRREKDRSKFVAEAARQAKGFCVPHSRPERAVL